MVRSLTTTFDPTRAWTLSAEVSLRDESFGALAYHHGNRRLVFLKSSRLVDLVRRLEEFANVDEALDVVVPRDERSRYLEALASLQRSDLLRER
ncbi:MAG TPA: mycofactocin biosynthesis chaperone MftB [Acidimicrobiales bacterium]|nr:mycofactocin biosynthesis chaperone MftB [Acidimicrobiales bacterium]